MVKSHEQACDKQYDHPVIAFLESVGVTVLGALFAGIWHGLGRPGTAGREDLAVGFDLLVAALVTEFAFLADAHGAYLPARWGGVFLLLIALPVMAYITKWVGYEDPIDYIRDEPTGRGPRRRAVYEIKSKAVLMTDIAGSILLCALWWLNVDAAQLVSDWKKVVP
jgi:hypothetical protein